MNLQLGKEIGRGGYGIVYECKDNPNVCIKKSNKKSNCRVWSNEFAKITNITKHVKSLEFVKLIVPTKFEENDDECFMEMLRIHNPLGKHITLHPLLGEIDYSFTDKKRGMFMGMKQLQEHFNFSNEYLNRIAHELGVTMSNIHFKGRNDAYDVEIYLGSDYKFYLADFDLSEEIETFDPETIQRMVWSLDAVSYFPTLDCCPDLYKIFKDGYFQNLNAEQKIVATLVFDLYD
jgi:serine/threonine protein kinase